MKTTAIPAQITTVEDRIAGNLTLPQLLLLVAPIFLGSAVYIIIPPLFHNAPYKIILIFCLFVVCSLLAIRIKGKLLLHWVIVISKYNIRPRYYVANKNSLYGRDGLSHAFASEIQQEATTTRSRSSRSHSKLSIADIVRIQRILQDPQSNLVFKTTKKGGLRVSITEIKP